MPFNLRVVGGAAEQFLPMRVDRYLPMIRSLPTVPILC
jgi:hypothetical protein